MPFKTVVGKKKNYEFGWIYFFGSGALPGLMLDLRLFKIIFSLFLAPAGGHNPTGPCPNPFPYHAGQS